LKGDKKMEYDHEHDCGEGIQDLKITCDIVSGDEYWYFDGYQIKFCPFCGEKLKAPSK
jgi:hypothetical protein